MDILVNLKEGYEGWLKECAGADRMYLGIGNIPFPNHTEVGEKCFIVHDGYIRGYQIIKEFKKRKNDFKDLETGKSYEAGSYVVLQDEFYFIPPVKKNDFEGYQYFKEKVSLEMEVPTLRDFPKVNGHRPLFLGDALIGEISEENLCEDGGYEIVIDFWSSSIKEKFMYIQKGMPEVEH